MKSEYMSKIGLSGPIFLGGIKGDAGRLELLLQAGHDNLLSIKHYIGCSDAAWLFVRRLPQLSSE
jgi:hypothetical protein